MVNGQQIFRVSLASLSLFMLYYTAKDLQRRRTIWFRSGGASNADYEYCPDHCAAKPAAPKVELDPWDTKNYVNGPPTSSMFDNFRNDTQYITTWLNAGWTNDVMTVINLVYLGLLTNRVAIMPPHVPMHVGYDVGEFDVGRIFDIPRLRRTIGHPIIEWKDVKNTVTDDHQDILGCWTLWATAEGKADGQPRGSRLQYSIHLDISYTRVPDNTKLMNSHNSFWGIARLSFPEGRAEALKNNEPIPSSQHGQIMHPNEQLMCFDILYYVSADQPFEFERDYSPAWRFVGRHMHFEPQMVRIAEYYMRKAFGLRAEDPIPKFVSMHIRRGDFADYCGGSSKEECLPPISTLAAAVREVREAVAAATGVIIQPQHVLLTSDEQDPNWWSEVKQQGWSYVDHAKEGTGNDLGKWYPVFIDAIIQSAGTGFVGTHGSTMSLLALRRVVDWNNGLGKMVQWGPGMYKGSS